MLVCAALVFMPVLSRKEEEAWSEASLIHTCSHERFRELSCEREQDVHGSLQRRGPLTFRIHARVTDWKQRRCRDSLPNGFHLSKEPGPDTS